MTQTKYVTYVCFVGIVNYYREMFRKWAHELAPLTKWFSNKVKFKFTDVDKNSFIVMEKIVGIYVLILYSNFSEEFIIHTDAIRTQTWEVIS